MTSGYAEFLERKRQSGCDSGFDPLYMPDFLFPFQAALCEWAIRKGRAAMFADCGLGKTPMQLVWAENVVRKTNRPTIILTPLAVSSQSGREAKKFGIEASVSRDGKVMPNITITNYERLHYFKPEDFSGIVLDESSILKHFDGATRKALTEFMRKIPYRLLATATAAPNDYTELGTSSEALGYLGHMDMLGRFFKNDKGNSATGRFHGKSMEWRFKGHAENPFWRWICSWARALRKPSDLGFDDDGFILPALIENEHHVEPLTPAEGMLFTLPAMGLQEERAERRRTIGERCTKAAALVNAHKKPAIVWCHLNDEGDLLEELIPGCAQVSGGDSEESKEEKLLAFASGQTRVLVTKPKIGAWGLNFQHCAHVVYFPSHSFEQYYQSVRRCWRFGQKRSVVVDIVGTDGEIAVMENLQRKARQSEAMFAQLVELMASEMGITRTSFNTEQVEVPSWLS